MLNCIAYSCYNCRQVMFILLVPRIYEIMWSCLHSTLYLLLTFDGDSLFSRPLSHPVQKYLKPMQMGLVRSRYFFESIRLYLGLELILFICNWHFSKPFHQAFIQNLALFFTSFFKASLIFLITNYNLEGSVLVCMLCSLMV